MHEYELDPAEQNLLDSEMHIVVPDSMREILGSIEESGSRSFIQRGKYEKYRLWSQAVFALTRGDVVSPGGASALLHVSRAAVYNNVRSGRLTMWTFEITRQHKKDGIVQPKGYTYIWLPCCELDAWNATIKWGRGENSASDK